MKNQTIRKLAAAVAMSLVVGASLVACGGPPLLPALPRPAPAKALAATSLPP